MGAIWLENLEYLESTLSPDSISPNQVEFWLAQFNLVHLIAIKPSLLLSYIQEPTCSPWAVHLPRHKGLS